MTRLSFLNWLFIVAACLAVLGVGKASSLTSSNSRLTIEPVPSIEEESRERREVDERTWFCGEEAWKRCIGNSRPCLCYERASSSRDTVEKAVLREYNDILVSRQYDRAGLIFAPDFVVEVPSYGIRIEGKESNLAYLLLGDPDVSDAYLILNSTILMMAQEENLVITHVREYFRALHSGNVFEVILSWAVTFNNKRQMQYMRILPDSQTMTANFVSVVDLNITAVCTRIQADCTGPLQQYPSVEACIAFLNSIPLSQPPQIAHGNTVMCRSFHEILARAAPSVHCAHVGTQNLGPIATPCSA